MNCVRWLYTSHWLVRDSPGCHVMGEPRIRNASLPALSHVRETHRARVAARTDRLAQATNCDANDTSSLRSPLWTLCRCFGEAHSRRSSCVSGRPSPIPAATTGTTADVMEHQREPPPYSSASSDLGSPPTAPEDLVQLRAQGKTTLPSLKSVLSLDFECQRSLEELGSPRSAIGLPRIEPRQDEHGSDTVMSETDHDSQVKSDDALTGQWSAEDEKVREAAEALAGLGNARVMPLEPGQEPPLLELLRQAHPIIGGTIQNSLSAYTATKAYTPRFFQAGAGLVERNIADPVVNTMGNVGRLTGAERAVRWYLTPRGGHAAVTEVGQHDGSKRRLILDEEMAIGTESDAVRDSARQRSGDSQTEPPPAYPSTRPPSYREAESPANTERAAISERPPHARTWSQHLVLHASGLGVALSDRSRAALVYCIGFLSRSAVQIETLANGLRLVLEQYDQARDEFHQHHDASMMKGERPQTPDQDASARRLAGIIKQHCDQIWGTLREVVHRVSDTVGGALPNQARDFVRHQLLSLPARWTRVSNNQHGDSETSRNAHRVFAFAGEGLQMMAHVSRTCQDTLDSAQAWTSAVGRGRPASSQALPEHSVYQHGAHGTAGRSNGDFSSEVNGVFTPENGQTRSWASHPANSHPSAENLEHGDEMDHDA